MKGVAPIAIIAIVVTLLLGGGAAYIVFQSSEPEPALKQQQEVQQTEEELSGIEDAMGSGVSAVSTEENSTPDGNPPMSQETLCDEEVIGVNKFVGCLYDGKDFQVLRAEAIPSQSVSSPALLSANPLNLVGDWARRLSPDDMQNGSVSMRWKGRFVFEPGDYTFFIQTYKDSGVRVRFNNIVKVDEWNRLDYGGYEAAYITYIHETFNQETELLIEVDYFANLEHLYFLIDFGWSPPKLLSGNQYCVVDYTQAPHLKQVAENMLQGCITIIPALERFLGVQPTLAPYLIKFKPGEELGGEVGLGGPFGASMNINSLESATDGNAYLSTLAHEFVHRLQFYTVSFLDRGYDDHRFMKEGIADYGRYYVMGYDEAICPGGGHYSKGYSCAALLFNYIERNYYSGFVKRVHQAMMDGTYTRDVFVQYTNKSVDQLWNECLQYECAP